MQCLYVRCFGFQGHFDMFQLERGLYGWIYKSNSRDTVYHGRRTVNHMKQNKRNRPIEQLIGLFLLLMEAL